MYNGKNSPPRRTRLYGANEGNKMLNVTKSQAGQFILVRQGLLGGYRFTGREGGGFPKYVAVAVMVTCAIS